MDTDPAFGRGGKDQSFSDAIGEVVHDYLDETSAVEIIGVLEAAKACVVKAAIKELQGGDEE